MRRINGCCFIKAGMFLKGVYGDLGTFPTPGNLISSGWPDCVSLHSPGFEIAQAVYENIEIYGLVTMSLGKRDPKEDLGLHLARQSRTR